MAALIPDEYCSVWPGKNFFAFDEAAGYYPGPFAMMEPQFQLILRGAFPITDKREGWHGFILLHPSNPSTDKIGRKQSRHCSCSTAHHCCVWRIQFAAVVSTRSKFSAINRHAKWLYETSIFNPFASSLNSITENTWGPIRRWVFDVRFYHPPNT